jgi:hypothetical protein
VDPENTTDLPQVTDKLYHTVHIDKISNFCDYIYINN